MLKDIWQKIAHKPAEKQAVNYVWINKEPFSPAPDGPRCGVPLSHLDMAYKNARKYPQAQFTVWLDNALLDGGSLEIVTDHARRSAPANVRLRDLNEIPSYRDTAIFHPPALRGIWVRADLARLLAMEHCFDESGEEAVIYSDFDVDDVRLDAGDMRRALRDQGIFVGSSKKNEIENGYIALHRDKGREFLKKTLLPKSIDDAQRGYDGFSALCQSLIQWFDLARNGNDMPKIYARRLHDRGHQIPVRRIYLKQGLN